MIIGYTFDGVSYPAAPFAQMVDELLDHNEGIVSGISLSNTTSKITIGDGRLIIKGRAFEVKGGEEVDVPATQSGELYCVLVAEIDLSKESSDSNFEQVSFKYLASASNYPSLTQQDINNAQSEDGIYQFELARFKNSVSGIKDFEDTRTFLNLNGIFTNANNKTNAVLQQIQEELENIEDLSDVLLKSAGGTITGDTTFSGKLISDNIQKSDGTKVVYKDDIAVLTGELNAAANDSTGLDNNTSKLTNKAISYPTGFNKDNSVVISCGAINKIYEGTKGYAFGDTSSSNLFSQSQLSGAVTRSVALQPNQILLTLGNYSTTAVTYKYKIVLMKIA